MADYCGLSGQECKQREDEEPTCNDRVLGQLRFLIKGRSDEERPNSGHAPVTLEAKSLLAKMDFYNKCSTATDDGDDSAAAAAVYYI